MLSKRINNDSVVEGQIMIYIYQEIGFVRSEDVTNVFGLVVLKENGKLQRMIDDMIKKR